MTIQENVSVGSKTTMKIGGQARYYAELKTRKDAEEAWAFAREKKLPLIALGAGANTVFADGTIEALVVRVAAAAVNRPRAAAGDSPIQVETGKTLAVLINELAEMNLDLSALTGIPGTVGGAIVGNAGQGPKGLWLDSFVESVTVYDGAWRTLPKADCRFSYRESAFKAMQNVIVWEATLHIPSRPKDEIKAEIERLLKKRFETQPHRLTAGSCFKAVDGTPAWQLIEKAGLRGRKIGGVKISEKHANFLINEGQGTFADLTALIAEARRKAPGLEGIEMRLFGADGKTLS